MKFIHLAGLAGAALLLAPPVQAQPSGVADGRTEAHVRALLVETPLIDGHNDLPWEFHDRWRGRMAGADLRQDLSGLKPPLHTDLVRLKAGGVGAQFWSVYVPVELQGPVAVAQVLEQMDIVRRLCGRYPDRLELAFTADDIVRIHKAGRIASLVGVEGGHAINDSLGVLRALYAGGARYMTLTHTSNTNWADAATDAPVHNGLTPFGREVVREMNRMGMLVDLSHVSAKTMQDAIAVSVAPVIFSHSSARALDQAPRNVPDQVLRSMAANGGVVMVNFYPGFVSEAVRRWLAEREAQKTLHDRLNPGNPDAAMASLKAWTDSHPAPHATLAQVADHVEHVRDVAGVDHVGLGADFDGIDITPDGLGGVDRFPALLAELSRRGWSDRDLRQLAGLNLLRAMHQAEAVARRLQAEGPASEALIGDLDRPASARASAPAGH